jgi:hypothetical protein
VYLVYKIFVYFYQEKKVEDSELQMNMSTPPKDERGLHANRPHALSAEQKDFVRETISEFPRYTSHYSRRSNPHKFCITAVGPVTELYRAYLQRFKDKKRRTHKIKIV